MKKIVTFTSSPRKNGFSTRLLEQVAEGAKASGAEVKVYDLNGPGVKGCQSCFYCRTNDGCATRDALQPMYGDIGEADAIVAAFPLYFGNISGQAKIWIDRLYPMIDGTFAPRHPGKKMVTIYAQANPDPAFMQEAIAVNDSIFKRFGWDLVKSFLIYDTGASGKTIDKEMMEEAFAVGKSLV